MDLVQFIEDNRSVADSKMEQYNKLALQIMIELQESHDPKHQLLASSIEYLLINGLMTVRNYDQSISFDNTNYLEAIATYYLTPPGNRNSYELTPESLWPANTLFNDAKILVGVPEAFIADPERSLMRWELFLPTPEIKRINSPQEQLALQQCQRTLKEFQAYANSSYITTSSTNEIVSKLKVENVELHNKNTKLYETTAILMRQNDQVSNLKLENFQLKSALEQRNIDVNRLNYVLSDFRDSVNRNIGEIIPNLNVTMAQYQQTNPVLLETLQLAVGTLQTMQHQFDAILVDRQNLTVSARQLVDASIMNVHRVIPPPTIAVQMVDSQQTPESTPPPG